MKLGVLLHAAGVTAPAGGDPDIAAITADSRCVEDGALFVAIPGSERDGHDYVDEAIARGAVAVVAERPVDAPGAVVLQVRAARIALAQLAAAWHGHPAGRMPLVGITGTVGKTSVLGLMSAILRQAGIRAGTIGSLGVNIAGEQQPPGTHTSPDALLLHAQLAQLAEAGCDVGAMEVTSHALVQDRVYGVCFHLGVLTNLIPLEHADFHGSFRSYVEAKSRFFQHLHACAPLIYNADDRVVRRLVHGRATIPVGCGTARTALVRLEPETVTAAGTRLTLNVRRSLPRPDGGTLSPFCLPLDLRLLGRSSISNAGLAATAALCLGAAPDDVRAALAQFPPPRRRMQIVHDGAFLVVDDTVGHPDSISAVFEVAQQIAPRAIHVAYAIRGKRGAHINRQNGAALAVWARQLPVRTLVVTRSTDMADARNEASDAEYAAFIEALDAGGVACETTSALGDAVHAVLERAGAGDLVLLLGAQGMDRGQEITRDWLAARGTAAEQ